MLRTDVGQVQANLPCHARSVADVRGGHFERGIVDHDNLLVWLAPRSLTHPDRRPTLNFFTVTTPVP